MAIEYIVYADRPKNVKTTQVLHGTRNSLGGSFSTNDAGISFKTAIQIEISKLPPNAIYTVEINGQQVDKITLSPIKTTQSVKPAETKTEGDIIIHHNETLNGIEIKFASKPSDTVINQLKVMGFRWSYKSMLWYNRYTVELWDKINAEYGKIGVC